jgi:hypothetical protein
MLFVPWTHHDKPAFILLRIPFQKRLPMEPSPHRRQQRPQGHGLRHVIKIMACGGMIGTAILFPLADAEGLWLRAV